MTKKPTLLDLLDERRKEEEKVEPEVEEIYEEAAEKYDDTLKKLADEPVEDLDVELRHTESGFPYYLHLPSGWRKCESLKEFYRLKEGEVVFDRDTVEPIPDQEFAIYSPSAGVYYIRKAMPGGTNYRKLKSYLEDKNLYIK